MASSSITLPDVSVTAKAPATPAKPAGRPKPDGDIVIKVGGEIVSGVERFELRCPAEGVPRSFLFSAARGPAFTKIKVLSEHLEVLVTLGGDQVLNGWTDRIQSVYDKSSHTMSVLGRGLCEIITDCQINVLKTGWSIAAKTMMAAAKAICDPFNITVVMPGGDVDLPEGLDVVAVFPGYSAYGFLEEYARSVGLLMFEDEQGRLVLTKGGTGGRAGSGIAEGVNVERVESMISADQRFADYYVLSQNRSLLTVGEAIIAHRTDPEGSFLSPRLRIIPQEFPDVSLDFSLRRAQWEANRRWGRSKMVRVTVSGWRDGQGQLWQPNTVVSVNLPSANIDETRCITEVVFFRDERGTRSILTLMPTAALDVQPFAVQVLP